MSKSQASTFEILDAINVNEFTDTKGKYTYLSWTYAVRELLRVAPNATWEIHEYESWHTHGSYRQPYMKTDVGYFVKVTVTIDGISRTQVHPVLDNKNHTLLEPNAFQINTSIQRCLAKAIALHGLGIYIYAGEDLPEPAKPLSNEQKKSIHILLSNLDDDKKVKEIRDKIKSEEINEWNYKASVAKLERLVNKTLIKETNND